MITAWVAVFLVLLFAFWLFWLCANTLGLALLIATAVFCITAAVVNRLLPPKISVKATLPASCDKAKEISGTVKIHNAQHTVYRCLKAELCIKNTLTGEQQKQTVKTMLYPKSTAEVEVFCQMRYCGEVCIALKNVRLYDFFGLTYKSVKIGMFHKATVLPDLLPVSLTARSDFDGGDSQSYADDRFGSDISEIFALREYTNGDSIRHIQWKLSEKHQKLIVKLGSEPNDSRLCLCMLTNGCKEPPVLSSMAELLCSMSISLCESNVTHEIFANGCFYSVNSENDLSALLSKILVQNDTLPEVEGFASLTVCITANEEESTHSSIIFIPVPKSSDSIYNIEI